MYYNFWTVWPIFTKCEGQVGPVTYCTIIESNVTLFMWLLHATSVLSFNTVANQPLKIQTPLTGFDPVACHLCMNGSNDQPLNSQSHGVRWNHRYIPYGPSRVDVASTKIINTCLVVPKTTFHKLTFMYNYMPCILQLHTTTFRCQLPNACASWGFPLVT